MCGTHSGMISMWDLRTYQKIADYDNVHTKKYDEGVLCLWSAGDIFISGGADGAVKIFNWFF